MIDRVRMMAIVRKEVLQLRRDPRSLLLAFALPLVLLVLFGYAITWDLNDIPWAVVDQDHTTRSRELIDAFRATDLFAPAIRLDDARPVGELFERRAARLALVIPPGFAADLDAGRPVAVQALIDGSDANTATLTLGYAQGIVRTYSARVTLRGARASVPVRVRTRVWFNEELRSRNMIVPGLVAVIMMIIAAMLTSLTIAREWERGTMEQLAATPVARLEVVLGKLLPYLAIGLIDLAACTVLGVLLFGVPFRGDALLLLVLSFFFLVGSLGLGLFISAATRSQLLATQVAMLATFLPAYLLSGFMFSIDVMPAPLRVFTYVIPARYFLVVTRGIFLKGVGIEVLYKQGLPMVAYAGIGLLLAVRAFRKELQ
jgi:ABC-2 type transport system permease protein